MRSFIATLVLFALLIGTVAINAIYVRSVCNKIESMAEELRSSSQRDTLIPKLKSTWYNNSPYLNLSIRTSEIERMGDLIESLAASYYAQNEAEFQKYCILISALADEFYQYEQISLDSIF